MKALRNLIAVLAMTAMAAVLTGCGDDDDDDDNNNNNTQFAPLTEAAVTDSTKVYSLNIATLGSATLRFPTANTYQLVANGQTYSGTVTGLSRNGNTWTATLTPDAGQPASTGGVLSLGWTGNNVGNFILTPSGQPAQTGTFIVNTFNPGDGGGGGNTNTNQNPGGTTGLVGKTLQITYPGAGGEKFTFTSDTNASYENGADTATYTYDTTTGQLNIVRGGGQTYAMVIPPNTSSGNTVVTYQEPGGNPGNDPATYTLQ